MFSISYWWSRWWSPLTLPICYDPTKTYIESSRVHFLKFLAANGGSIPMSANIDPVVYDKTTFHKVLMDGDNILEKSWRARILVECVPVAGNIVMFYDIFKQGFSYYCDQPVVPYDMLNSVAMKYVERFRCVDFFLDEHVVGVGGSPLKAVFMGEEAKPAVDSKVGVKVDIKTGPFAKLKNYSVGAARRSEPAILPVYFRTSYPWFWKLWYRVRFYFVAPLWHFWGWCLSWVWKPCPEVIAEPDPVATKEPEKIRNKFIYLGRFRNLQLLQLPVKKGVFGGSTKYDAMFKCGKGVSYKDFKLSGGSGAAAF